jgi:hypothetical protein
MQPVQLSLTYSALVQVLAGSGYTGLGSRLPQAEQSLHR